MTDGLRSRSPAAGDQPLPDDSPGPGRARRRPIREAIALLYCILALTFIHFHGSPVGLSHRWRLFAWFGVNFLVLFGGAALIVKFLWREPLRKFGLQWGDARTWGRYFALYLLIMAPIVLVMSRTPEFHAFYPQCDAARHSLAWWAFSAAGWLLYFFAWEWFFRGFLLFSLAPRYGGAMAILIQTIPFAMMHFPKVEAEAWSSILAGVFLGLMAFRGRSCLSAWLIHWSVATLMDLSVILWPLH